MIALAPGLILMVATILAPMGLLSVISHRIHRRGAWILGPWLATALLVLCVVLLNNAFSRSSGAAAGLSAAALIAGYVGMMGTLLLLAIAGPGQPKISAEQVF